MIQKIVNTFKLDRPYRYYIFLYIIVLALTYINNFFYYESVESKENKNIENYIQNVNSYSSTCVKFSNGDINKCINEIKEFAKNSSDYYGHRVLIGGKEVIDNRRYPNSTESKPNPDERKSNTVTGELSAIGLSIEVTRNSIPIIWKSVVRSATYSISDVIKKIQKKESWEKIHEFITQILVWRSAPHISFFVLIFFVSFLMRGAIIKQMELINELEDLEEDELEALEKEFDNDESNY